MTALAEYVLEIAKHEYPQNLPAWNLGRYLNHLSPTSLAMARMCPRQFQERYIHKHKERPAEALTVGSGVHLAVEHNLGQKIESHEDIPVAEILEWYSDVGFPSAVADQEGRGGGEILWDATEADAKARGLQMVGAYHRDVMPRLQPLAVETRIELDFGAPVPIQGIFDAELPRTMLDVKTGKRTQRKLKEAWRIQGAIYYEARQKPVEFHHISATAQRHVPTIVTPLESEAMLINPGLQERARMREDIRLLAAQLVLYMHLLGPDQPWPTFGKFHDWACDYCGYRKDCPAWA